MCDYSLMTMHNRLAVEGEELIAHRFRSGSTGLVSSVDFAAWQARRPTGFWHRLKDCFSQETDPAPVVCVPPGARILLHVFGSCEKATFTQISPDSDRYRDALLFDGGGTVLVQLLPEGRRITVLRLPAADASNPDPAVSELVGV